MICSRTPVLCVILWFVSAGALAETGQVLSLEELDDDGKTTSLDGKSLAIVDINSEIKVRLDPNALQVEVVRALGGDAVSGILIQRAQILLEASDGGLALIKSTNQAIEEFNRGNKSPEAVAKLANALNEAASPALSVLEIAMEDPALRERLNAAYDKALMESRTRIARSRALFETAAAYAGELKQTVDEALRKEGAYVQLGAWIVQGGSDRPLHLDGFDEYPEGDFFDVDRWTLLPLNEQQRQQLKDLEAAAKKINEKGIGELLKVENVTNIALRNFLDHAQQSAEKIESALASLQKVAQEQADSVLTRLENAREDQRKYAAYVQSLRDKYAGGSAKAFSFGAALLESTHADLVTLQQKTGAFVSGQIDHVAAIRSEIQDAAQNVNAELAKTEQVLQECKKEMSEGVAGLAGQLSDLMGIVQSSQEINTAVLEFGEEVLKHTLDKVPQSTELRLKRAGARKAGDVVVLKLAAGGAQKPREILDERRLDLYRVLPHIEMALGMIFADPLEDTEVENRFQAAPSYSVLLKGFGDRGVAYNRLYTPGFGVNVSALDFNKDDTPELGISVVGSIFRDYFQVGYGYNINEDADYWFFGLRLPLATFTFPYPENEAQP